MALTFTARAAAELRGRLRQLGAGGVVGAHLPRRRALAAQLLLAAGRRRPAAARARRQGPRARPRRRDASAEGRHGDPARCRGRDRVAQGLRARASSSTPPPRRPHAARHARPPSRSLALLQRLRGPQGRAPADRLRGRAARVRRHDRERAGGGACRCASSTASSSSTSTRTSRRCSTSCSTSGSATAATCAWSATRARPSTRSRAPAATTCSASSASIPAPRSCGWSRTTGRPRRSIDTANRLMRGRPGALTLRPADGRRTAPTASPSRCRSPPRSRTTGPRRAAVAEQIAAELAAGARPEDIAVLYRVNVQAAALEQALGDAGVSYQIRGVEAVLRPARGASRRVMSLRARLGVDRGRAAVQVGQRRAALARLDVQAARGARRRARPLGVAQRHHGAGRRAAARARRFRGFTDELLERQAGQHEPTMSAVTLATLHSAKGLEWAVRVPRRSERGPRADQLRRRRSSRSTRSAACSTSASPARGAGCASAGRRAATSRAARPAAAVAVPRGAAPAAPRVAAAGRRSRGARGTRTRGAAPTRG